MYSTKSDNELCRLLKEGDHRAFLEVYDRYSPLLQQHAHRRITEKQEVEDVLQELFSHLWERRHSMTIEANLPGYLYKALRNRILNHFARKKTQEAHLLSLANHMELAASPADHHLRENELALLIQQEIDALPPKMRKVFLLHRSGELTYKQIAEKTGTSDHTIATQIKTALRILRERLKAYRWLFTFFF